MADTQHIFKVSGAPSAAPSSAGHHYIDTATGNLYFSKGAASPSDWLKLPRVASDISDFASAWDAILATKSTTDLSEGTNLYYTTARFDSALATKSTTNLAEGTNLYYTAARFNTAFSGKSTTDLSEGTNLYYTTTRFDAAFSGKTTSDLAEGTNLYFTTTRAKLASVADAISDGVTDVAPSQNAVFDALVLKINSAGGTFTGAVTFQGNGSGTGTTIFPAQSSDPTTPASGTAVFSNANEFFSVKGQSGFAFSINDTALTENRQFDLPDADGTLVVDPTASVGDTIYRGSSGLTRLPIGSADFIMRVSAGLPSWQEENLLQDFGDGSDGNLNLTGSLTLSQIMYYNVLTISAGAVLNTNGYPVYCKVLDLSNAPAGSIIRNGVNGATVAANTGGAAGTALVAAVLGGSAAGSAGAAGATNAGTASAVPGNATNGNGGGGGASGASGAGGTGAAVVSGAGGTATPHTHLGRFEYTFLRGAGQITGGAGGDGGNSGGGDGANSSRGAGGGGSGGGVMAIYAGEIITSASTPAGVIRALGGNGGSGGNAPLGNVGGNSGGGGGGGGYIYITYVKRTGPVVTGLINASGGNGANGGNGIGTGIGGGGGSGGNGGFIQLYNVTTAIGVETAGASGTPGTAGSGTAGGAGGPGGVCVVSL